MSSYNSWPNVEPAKVNALWFRPLQPVREEFSLTKLEEMLDQARRQCVEKGASLPFHGRSEMDNTDEDEDADEPEEESEGGEPDDEVEAQQAFGSPGTAAAAPSTAHEL